MATRRRGRDRGPLRRRDGWTTPSADRALADARRSPDALLRATRSRDTRAERARGDGPGRPPCHRRPVRLLVGLGAPMQDRQPAHVDHAQAGVTRPRARQSCHRGSKTTPTRKQRIASVLARSQMPAVCRRICRRYTGGMPADMPAVCRRYAGGKTARIALDDTEFPSQCAALARGAGIGMGQNSTFNSPDWTSRSTLTCLDSSSCGQSLPTSRPSTLAPAPQSLSSGCTLSDLMNLAALSGQMRCEVLSSNVARGELSH